MAEMIKRSTAQSPAPEFKAGLGGTGYHRAEPALRVNRGGAGSAMGGGVWAERAATRSVSPERPWSISWKSLLTGSRAKGNGPKGVVFESRVRCYVLVGFCFSCRLQFAAPCVIKKCLPFFFHRNAQVPGSIRSHFLVLCFHLATAALGPKQSRSRVSSSQNFVCSLVEVFFQDPTRCF